MESFWFLAGVAPRVSFWMSQLPSPHVVKGQLMALSCLSTVSLTMGWLLRVKAKVETRSKAKKISLDIVDRLII